MNALTTRCGLTAAGLAVVLLLGACAEQAVRDDASAHMRDGQFEAAIQGLKDGLSRYPDSTTLRAGLTSSRSEALSRLVAQVAQLRTQGKFDDADKAIQRALALEPDNPRLRDLRNDLVLARRQRAVLEDVSALIAQDKKELALRKLEAALRETPRQPDLVALQRRLQLELRLDSGSSGQVGLAETRPITLDFKNAPLSVVLDAITKGSGVNFVLDRDVRLDNRVTVYLRNARVGDAIDLVVGANQLARNIVDPQSVFIYPNTPEKKREHQEQVIRVFYLGSAEAKTTGAFLRSMLHIKDPFIDERANMIAIREAPEIVALAERLVALHDVGEPEVMLDLEVMEVSATRLTSLGLDFPNSLTFSALPEAGATGLTVSSLRSLNSDRVGVSMSNLVLNLRREVGDTNILASPKIRAKNREKAHILIGDKVPTITSTTSATGFVSQSVSYQDVGLKLDVEPVISPEDDVTIKLALEVSNLGTQVTTTAGTVAYQIGTRNANTTLRLRDGETQLLAGLINKQDSSTAHRFPGLGDLPIAGRLFSSQRDDGQRTELVLAITPHILRSAPRPDLSEAEMWVGSELATKLHARPDRKTSVSLNSPRDVAKPPANTAPAAGPASPTTQVTPAVSVPAGPVRALWKAPETVKVGDVFTVVLQLASATPLRGAPLEIGFPAELVDVVEVVEGAYFRQDDGVTSFTHAVNRGNGRIGVGVLRSDATGAAGQAPVLELRLKAKAAGSVQLQITSLKPIPLGAPVAVGELPLVTLTVQ